MASNPERELRRAGATFVLHLRIDFWLPPRTFFRLICDTNPPLDSRQSAGFPPTLALALAVHFDIAVPRRAG
jgi:hypothetical protein